MASGDTYVVRSSNAERRGRVSIPIGDTVVPPPPPPDSFILGETKPTASNTGAGILRAYPTVVATGLVGGVLTLTGTQSLVDKVVNGRVVCKGNNLIENCVINGGAAITSGAKWFINTSGATAQADIRFTTITCTNPTAWTNGIGERNYFAYRCLIEKTTDLFAAYCTTSGFDTPLNVKIHGCYGRQMVRFAPDYANGNRAETHNDWIQVQGGQGVDLFGNNMQAYHHPTLGTVPIPSPHEQIAAVMLTANTARITDITIRNNWIGGGQQAINGGAVNRAGTPNVVNVYNNIFDRGARVASDGDTLALCLDTTTTGTISNNKYEDGEIVKRRAG